MVPCTRVVVRSVPTVADLEEVARLLDDRYDVVFDAPPGSGRARVRIVVLDRDGGASYLEAN